MTSPKHARKKTGRLYVWPAEEPHELEVPSTTTILSNGIPKPFLKWWAAKLSAEYAVEHHAAWSDLPPEDAVELIKKAHLRAMKRKAALGTSAHEAAEDYLNGRDRYADLDGDSKEDELARLEAQTSDVVYGYYRAARAFLTDWQVEPLPHGIEATVYSREHEYAGTADLFASVVIPGQDGRVNVVCDWKTSKRIYPEVALQLNSYAFGDFIGDDDGETEHPVPEVEGALGVRLTEQGRYEVVPLEVSERVFESFLAAKGVAYWTRTLSNLVAGKPIEGEAE